ncbi:MAG: hypothetical protein HRT61_21140, partial [Ekhidna sp.]|nr:hypothetical protein [Ekhidna sp.]
MSYLDEVAIKKGMIKKKLYLLVPLIFSLVGCCDSDTYEVSISGLSTRALAFDGINAIEVEEENPIDKEDLVIELLVLENEKVASNDQSKEYQIVNAAVVPCADDEFIYINRIVDIKVESIESNGERINLTNQLIILGSEDLVSAYI